jgi:sirohydrochlorin cobaltochelatase
MSSENFKDATLIVLGHGTTLNDGSALPVMQHAAELRGRGIFAAVREAFWKQEPHIKSVITAIKTPRIIIAPLMISEGYFASEVIPRELGLDSDFRLQTKDFRLFYAKPVGTHPSMTKVLLARAAGVVEKHPFPRAPKPRDITLFIAGHGTERSAQSRIAIERQVELIHAMNLYADVRAIYMDENPRIENCQTTAATKNVVVVPFFISDGLHTTEDIPVLLGEPEKIVKEKLAAAQPTWRNPTERHGKLTWYSQAIGSEPMMADVIMERVLEAVA